MTKRLLTALALSATFAFAFAQTDVTSKYVKNPSFEQNGTTGWTVSGLVTQTNTSFTKKSGGTYLEKWVAKGSAVGSGSVKQTLTALRPGKYTLKVGAQNLDQNSTTKKCTGAKIYAGKASTTVYTPDDYSVDFTYLQATSRLVILQQVQQVTGLQ